MDGGAPVQTTIRKCTVDQIMLSPDFAVVGTEYEATMGNPVLPSPMEQLTGKLETYRSMEASGMLHAFGAFHGEQLVGFLSLIMPIMPRYSTMIAVSESYYVLREYRSTGAGLRLLKAAEDLAFGRGSPGIYVSAPWGGALGTVLERRGYTASNVIYFKKAPQCALN